MTDLADEQIIAEAVDEDAAYPGKTFPYLGWYWRAFDEQCRISLVDGKAVIDEAGKWDYPGMFMSIEDTARLRSALLDMGRAKIAALSIVAEYDGRFSEGGTR